MKRLEQTERTSEISQIVTFELEDGIFGMDIMVAQEIGKYENIRPIPNAPSYFDGFKNLRGEIIPIINFKKLFSFSKFDMSADKNIIIIEIENAQFGIVVDKVLRVVYYEESEAREVRKNDDNEISNYIMGVIEHNNQLISVLDMKAIFNYADKTLRIGSNDDEYILKHKRDKNVLNTLDNIHFKHIKKILVKAGFPVNDITEWALKKFIAKTVVTKHLPIDTVVNYIMRNFKEARYYNNFNYNGEKIFFDVDNDYLALQKLLSNILIPRKRSLKNLSLKVWNIGCENGAEAYSTAFLIKNALDDFFNWNINIICSGVDYEKLSKAEKGTYPKHYFEKFFVKNFEEFLQTEEDDNEKKNLNDFGENITVIEDIRKIVSFDMRDIYTSPPIECDIILVRNFISSLDADNCKKIIKLFSNSLKKGGLLLLSEVEGIEIYTNDFVPREIINRAYYVKV